MTRYTELKCYTREGIKRDLEVKKHRGTLVDRNWFSEKCQAVDCTN